MTTVRSICRLSLLLAALAGANAIAADAAAPQAKDPQAKRCLRLAQINSTEIVDSKHIVFKMNDGTMYVSNLPHRCPGLTDDKAWLHKATNNEICDLDIITVTENIGGSLTPGASCGLGKFEPLAKPDLEALRVELKEDKKAQ
jgi:hypothetical protein